MSSAPLLDTLRNQLTPELLSRTASQLREDAAVLLNDSDALLKRAAVLDHVDDETGMPVLDVKVLAAEPPALRRRATPPRARPG